jgi:hypothetical protein
MPNNNNPFMPGASAPTTPMPGAPTNAPMPGAPTSPDSFEVDLTDVQDGFTIPDGVYKVKCIDIEQSVSKGGNPMFVWTFEVSEGNHVGFQSKVFTAITPAAMWKVAETVQALGVGQTGQTVKFKRTDVINKECGAMIETTEYNGQSRSQISKVLSMEEYLKAKEG